MCLNYETILLLELWKTEVLYCSKRVVCFFQNQLGKKRVFISCIRTRVPIRAAGKAKVWLLLFWSIANLLNWLQECSISHLNLLNLLSLESTLLTLLSQDFAFISGLHIGSEVCFTKFEAKKKKYFFSAIFCSEKSH